MRGGMNRMAYTAVVLVASGAIGATPVRAHDPLHACTESLPDPAPTPVTSGAYAYRFAAWDGSRATASDAPPPVLDPCETECQQQADAALEACVAGGGSLQQCVEPALTVRGQCLVSQCGRPPFEPPCELTCHLRAQQVFGACKNLGHSDSDCAAVARETLNNCLRVACGLTPQTSPCAFGCHQAAEQVFQSCLANDGSDDACTIHAREKLNACLENECHVLAPESACVTACHRQAEQMFQGCVATGTTHGVCADAARTLMDACQRLECGLPPLEPPCEARCEQDGEDFYYDCLGDGHPEAGCAASAREQREECLEDRCGAEPGCGAYCPRRRMADPPHDSIPRRRDRHNGLANDAAVPDRIVELLETSLGTWAPANAAVDLFIGEFRATGGFLRLDLRFAGLVNPPGKAEPNAFQPNKYGPRPVYGFVEIDMDANLATGGEVDSPQYRYLGNAARFGGHIRIPALRARAAIDASAFDHNVATPPFVERSGEEFHLALLGGETTAIRELRGNGNDFFDRGEAWLLTGAFFHRAHGYEKFSLAEGGRSPGQYMPPHKLLFVHDVIQNVTTVTLVFPLTNAAAAMVNGAGPQAMNNNPSDQASVLEGLDDLHDSASFVAVFPTSDPAQSLISNWETESPSNYLNPNDWKITVLVGTNHPVVEPSQALFLWTDLFPNVLPGDVDGNGARGDADVQAIRTFIAANDGRDGKFDAAVVVRDFASGFSLYDVDYDGVVDLHDIIRENGDADIDGDIDLADFATQQSCFGRAGAFMPCVSVNFNGDDTVDLNDIRVFGWSLDGPGGN